MVKNEEDIEQLVEEANGIRTWMDQSTDDHALILETLGTMLKAIKALQILEKPKVVNARQIREPVYRKASPGFNLTPSRRVVEYEKKDGTTGFKIKGGDVIFEKQAFKYLQECIASTAFFVTVLNPHLVVAISYFITELWIISMIG